MPISRTIQPIGQRINKPRFIDAGVLCAAGSSGTPSPSTPTRAMAVEHSANPDANLRAFAQRGDHRVEPAINEMRIALLRADIDLSCAEAAPTNRRMYN